MKNNIVSKYLKIFGLSKLKQIVYIMRTSEDEYPRNKYFNWDREYEICKQIAKDLRIDFFRIDFFYSKKDNILYAGEMAFRPSTLLGNQIENFILTKWKGMI